MPSNNSPIPCVDNICAVIVTYFPDRKFPERLKLILRQINFVIIVDNASSGESRKMLSEIKNDGHVEILFNGANEGVARGLNLGIQQAQKLKFSWVITFDQDTTVEPFMVSTLIDTYHQIKDKNSIAIIGVNHIDIYSNKLSVSRKYKGNLWIEKKNVITSGGFMQLSSFNKIGLFREEFFIDHVDHEYCLRAIQKGFKIYFILKPLMKHSIGEVKLHYVFGITRMCLPATNHSPFRWYFITRNAVILFIEYFLKDPIWSFCHLYRMLKAMGVMALFEKNRIQKFRFITLGILDGLPFNTRRLIRPLPDQLT